MQWLIDIISCLFANRHRYFDRGDAVTTDYDIGDLFADDTWHSLDLSALVPADTVLVSLWVVMLSASINKRIQFRENGNTGTANRSALYTQVANVGVEGHCPVALDANRIIDYRITTGYSDYLFITVCGWWKE